jgi:hypothetical protein
VLHLFRLRVRSSDHLRTFLPQEVYRRMARSEVQVRKRRRKRKKKETHKSSTLTHLHLSLFIRCPLCQGHLNALQSTRRLQQYFVLDREAWNDAHTQAVSGTWWTEQLITFPSNASAEVVPSSPSSSLPPSLTRSSAILPASRAGRRGANSHLVTQNP